MGWRMFGVQTGGEERIARGWADSALEGAWTCHRRGLIGGDRQRHARTFDGRRAVQHRDQSGLSGGAGHDIVTSGPGHPDHAARGLDRPGFVRGEVFEMEVSLALRLLGLKPAGIQSPDVEFGLPAQRHDARRNLQLRLGRGLGPKIIARADGVVRRGGAPLRVGTGAEGHGAGLARDAADPVRRIGLILTGRRGGRGQGRRRWLRDRHGGQADYNCARSPPWRSGGTGGDFCASYPSLSGKEAPGSHGVMAKRCRRGGIMVPMRPIP